MKAVDPPVRSSVTPSDSVVSTGDAAGTGAAEGRDRTIDAVRAIAIGGVVFGHWLVTALVSEPDRPGALVKSSPLEYAPGYAPATWLLQTLGLFFFAAGFAASRARARIRAHAAGPAGRPESIPRNGGSVGHRVRAEAGRLVRMLVRVGRPVIGLLVFSLPALGLLSMTAPAATVRIVRWLLFSPLWYLLVYLALSALLPVLRSAVRRVGSWAAVAPAVVVALADLVRVQGIPGWLYPLTVLAGWSVPYLLGVALAERRLGRSGGGLLLVAGLVGGAMLIGIADYPASAVGVAGQRWSNLDPPSSLALAVASVQIGAFLLVRPALRRLLRRPAWWVPVAAVNRGAMTVYCWHQPILLLVTFVTLPFGPLPGLHDVPDGNWLPYRLAWLPLLALLLLVLGTTFHSETRLVGGRRR